MRQFQDLKYKFNRLNVFGKIIAFNVFIFVITIVFDVININGLFNYFFVPSNIANFIVQPWSILTYSFFHTSIWHLLFNMLMLFYLSNVAINLFEPKLVLNVYFLGIIFGGLLYLGVSNLWPTDFFSTNGILLGASAGVSALLAFVATYLPNTEIRLFGTFNVKWKHIAFFLLGLDIIRLLSGINQGGYVSHLGGYGLGFFYAMQLQKGSDIGKGFERLMDGFVNWFKPKSTLKTVHRKHKSPIKNTKKTKSVSETYTKQKQIDIILDKISKSGYESLTAKEKEFLFRAGKD